jgi:hypothetical protein
MPLRVAECGYLNSGRVKHNPEVGQSFFKSNERFRTKPRGAL